MQKPIAFQGIFSRASPSKIQSRPIRCAGALIRNPYWCLRRVQIQIMRSPFVRILSPQQACASVWEHRHSDEYAAVKMQLYGLYKVAKEGKCQEPKPETVSGGSPRSRQGRRLLLVGSYADSCHAIFLKYSNFFGGSYVPPIHSFCSIKTVQNSKAIQGNFLHFFFFGNLFRDISICTNFSV